MTESTITDWVRGDLLGLDLPAHPAALLAGGAEFLTRAFRAGGALGEDNKVTHITRFDECLVGGTGVKAMLSVAYAHDEPGLPTDLFVKFSRHFTNRARDGGRHHMAPEVRFANMSREAAVPVAVPRCLYADIHHATATGILITERIPYGQGAVEPHHPKCMDQILPEPLAHYRVLVSALARLSGAHKSGRLGDAVERLFPLDTERLSAFFPRYEAPQLITRVDRLADFIAQYPHLSSPHIADRAFLDSLRAAAPLAVAQQDAIRRFQTSRPDMIALCHLNANIDNAWFWRESDGTLRCGLIDWGSVGQMPVAQSIWGCVGAAEPDMIDQHLDELLDLFVAEYASAGGPTLDKAELERHLELYVMMTTFVMTTAAPAILREIADPGTAADRYDPIFTTNETARVQLKITVNVLDMWRRRDLGRLLQADAFWRT